MLNPLKDPGFETDPVSPEVRQFHRSLSGYAPTPLIEVPELAKELGVGRVFAKDESNRLGLPAFKALGASWAIRRALVEAGEKPTSLVTASDGNHGRAVAHFARLLGLEAEIFLPEGAHPAAVEAIREEGATVHVLAGSYDDAVEAAATRAARAESEGLGRQLVQDTAWPGYVQVPQWIVDGYSTMFAEIDEQATAHGVEPDLILVPTGVGSLIQAAIAHHRSPGPPRGTKVVSVEPTDAACVVASLVSGERATVETGHTVMAGLNCGTLSSLAWPYVEKGVDGCATVTDDEALTAAHDLARLGIDAGPCGAASLAGVRALYLSDLDLPSAPTVVLLITEGSAANPWHADAS